VSRGTGDVTLVPGRVTLPSRRVTPAPLRVTLDRPRVTPFAPFCDLFPPHVTLRVTPPVTPPLDNQGTKANPAP